MPLSDEEVAEGVKQVKAARRHDLKWWAIAAGCFVLYLIIFGPANAKRAEEEERADTYKWIQEQKQKEQDQRQKDALRAFTR
jgi:hypothetical protein